MNEEELGLLQAFFNQPRNGYVAVPSTTRVSSDYRAPQRRIERGWIEKGANKAIRGVLNTPVVGDGLKNLIFQVASQAVPVGYIDEIPLPEVTLPSDSPSLARFIGLDGFPIEDKNQRPISMSRYKDLPFHNEEMNGEIEWVNQAARERLLGLKEGEIIPEAEFQKWGERAQEYRNHQSQENTRLYDLLYYNGDPFEDRRTLSMPDTTLPMMSMTLNTGEYDAGRTSMSIGRRPDGYRASVFDVYDFNNRGGEVSYERNWGNGSNLLEKLFVSTQAKAADLIGNPYVYYGYHNFDPEKISSMPPLIKLAEEERTLRGAINMLRANPELKERVVADYPLSSQARYLLDGHD